MTSDSITVSSRPGAALNIEDPAALLPYLRSHERIGPSETIRMTRLTGGVSNRIVLVESAHRPGFVLKQALEKLRVASDWFGSPARIHCEAQGVRVLRKLAPEGTITALLFEDFAEHVIALSAVPKPHSTLKLILLSGTPRLRHFRMFGQILGQIHARSSNDAHLAEAFDDRSNFESLRLEPYYRFSAARLPAAARFLQELIEETLSYRVSLVHGDYSPKNILVHGGRFVLIDHEVIHYGDPAFDVGFALTHLLAKALHRQPFRPRLLEGAQLFAGTYLRSVRKVGFDHHFEARACRHTMACLLARVVGRSPVEYLTATEGQRQIGIAMDLIHQGPFTLLPMISRFQEALA